MSRVIVQLLWLVVVLTCLTMAITLVFAQAKSSPALPLDPAVIISEHKTFFSYGVVIALLGIAGAAITAMVTSRAHINNTDIHANSGWLADRFQSKEDCQKKHQEMRDDFQGVNIRLDEQSKTLGRIEGRLEYLGGK